MRLQFDRTTVIFIIFILLIGAIFGINRFIQSSPPVEISIVVDPLAEEWLKAAAASFNQGNVIVNNTTRVTVQITVMDDLDIWRANPTWTVSNHPDGWLASSSASLSYLPSNLGFRTIHASTARTPLVWGGFSNRVTIITNGGTRPFDWLAVQEVANAATWANLGTTGGNVNMAINWASSSMSGVGALYSAAASQAGVDSLTEASLASASFSDWFQPIEESLLNSQRLGGNPAQAMAARGTSAADYALLPEVQWLAALEGFNGNNLVLAYPAQQFSLDFPLAAWQDANTDPVKRAGVEAFGTFLMSAEGQALAVNYGLRPAIGEPDSTATRFARGLSAGILLTPDYGTLLAPPSRSLADALIRLLN